LGSQNLDGIATSGYNNTMTMAMTHATGSCRNGSFSMNSTQYFALIKEPQMHFAAGPAAHAPSARVPIDPRSLVSQGGCIPRFTVQSSGPTPPAGRFIMYSRISMQPQNASANASGFAFVTERGNVKMLSVSAAAMLFEIPPGFTREQ
ncbi:MAG: hypothetical protein ABI182_02575, partial [Candidatus Baltobacteraceae bacterium]